MTELMAIVKKAVTKDGREFMTCWTKKKYCRQDDEKSQVNGFNRMQETEIYHIRVVGGKPLPAQEGIYHISCADGDRAGAWVDLRNDIAEKHIIRAKNPVFRFIKELQHFDDEKKEENHNA